MEQPIIISNFQDLPSSHKQNEILSENEPTNNCLDKIPPPIKIKNNSVSKKPNKLQIPFDKSKKNLYSEKIKKNPKKKRDIKVPISSERDILISDEIVAPRNEIKKASILKEILTNAEICNKNLAKKKKKLETKINKS